MKRLKRFVSLFAAFALATAPFLAASAAKLTTTSTTSNQTPKLLSISSITQSSMRYDGTVDKYFPASNLLDDNASTTWQPFVESYSDVTRNGLDDYVTLLFTRPKTITSIWIRNGICGSQKLYDRNSRPSEFTADFQIQYSESFSPDPSLRLVYAMEDGYDMTRYDNEWRYGYQCLSLPEPIENVYAIRLTITDIYKSSGANWHYVCVSDVYVEGY